MRNLTPHINKYYIKSDGKTAITMITYINEQRIKIPTGISIEPKFWDDQKKIIKSNCKFAEEYNTVIGRMIGQAAEINTHYLLSRRELTPALFKKEMMNPATKIDFLKWALQEIEQRKGTDITLTSARMHKYVLIKLKDYQNYIAFSELTEDFIRNYERYLKSVRKNNANTISKDFRTIKTYINLAIEQDIIKKNPFQKFKIKAVEPTRVSLDVDEIKILIEFYKKDIVTEKMHEVLRAFLFSCFTGLRLSDIKQITYDMIFDNTLVFVPQKTRYSTHRTVSVPLKAPALKLIKTSGKGKIFNMISDQCANRDLKIIATKAGIKKAIHFHSARHTFGSTFITLNPGDVTTLQSLMGHSKIEQTLIYVHTDERIKRKRMEEFDQFEI